MLSGLLFLIPLVFIMSSEKLIDQLTKPFVIFLLNAETLSRKDLF